MRGFQLYSSPVLGKDTRLDPRFRIEDDVYRGGRWVWAGFLMVLVLFLDQSTLGHVIPRTAGIHF